MISTARIHPGCADVAVAVAQIPDYRNAVMVARHPGAVKRATSYAERLRLGFAVIHGEGRVHESEEEDGRNSPPPPSSSLSLDHRMAATGLELPSQC